MTTATTLRYPTHADYAIAIALGLPVPQPTLAPATEAVAPLSYDELTYAAQLLECALAGDLPRMVQVTRAAVAGDAAAIAEVRRYFVTGC